jgi:hypothetical protein
VRFPEASERREVKVRCESAKKPGTSAGVPTRQAECLRHDAKNISDQQWLEFSQAA